MANLDFLLSTKAALSKKQLLQEMVSRQAMNGHPISNVSLKQRVIEIDEVSESDNEVEVQIQKLNEHGMLSQEVTQEVKEYFHDSKGFILSSLQQPNVHHHQSGHKSKSQTKRIHTINIKDQLTQLDLQKQLQNPNHTVRFEPVQPQQTMMSYKDQTVNLGRRATPAERKAYEQNLWLEQMQRLGNKTTVELDLKYEALESKVKADIKEPLFKKGGLPTIRSHSQMKTTVDSQTHRVMKKSGLKSTAQLQSSSRNNNQVSQQITVKKLNSQETSGAVKLKFSKTTRNVLDDDIINKDDKNVITKLLKKHVPDYEKKLQAYKDSPTQDGKGDQLDLSREPILPGNFRQENLPPIISDDQVKKRRRALVERIKQLKRDQTEKSMQIIESEKPFERRLTVREKISLQQKSGTADQGSQLKSMVMNSDPKFEVEEVVRQMPELVHAQSVNNLEISRLTNDPIFGTINQSQIMNADENIRSHRLKEDPAYQIAMKTLAKKIKQPVTDEELELRRENNKIKECEKLITKMDKVMSTNSLYDPATVDNHRGFKISSHITSSNKINLRKMKGRKSSRVAGGGSPSKKDETTSSDPMKVMMMIEYLQEREKEIAISESNLISRRMSHRATEYLHDGKVLNSARQKQIGLTEAQELMNFDQMQLEQDAKNKITMGESMKTLDTIDKNLQMVSRILGKSKSQTAFGQKGKKKYKTSGGNDVSLGSGINKVTAVNQRQANLVNQALKPTFQINTLMNR